MNSPAIVSQQDSLSPLRKNVPLRDKIRYLHEVINQRHIEINRLAVAIYDEKTDLLKTFVHSSDHGEQALDNYESRLGESQTLSRIRDTGEARLVNDLQIFVHLNAPHARRIREMGYSSSYTLPIYEGENFFGFLFFNSRTPHAFTEELLHYLDLCAHLLSLSVIQEVCRLQTLTGAVETARNMTHHRDNETGGHLERMSRFSRLIAQELAASHGLDDEYIEHIFLFAPLHDIGKIAIPDGILLKPGRLTADEYAVMKTHTEKGSSIIDSMLANLGLSQYHHIQILRNIALYHHECMDGCGYPFGLAGDKIPLEARIISVADIFDALTSKRPYKHAWSVDEAFAYLREQAQSKLDPACVKALLNNREKVEAIRSRFDDESPQPSGPFPGLL